MVGAEDLLQLTEKERIEELVEWDLFDLPLPDAEDPDNPLYRHQLRQNAFRFSMRDPLLYTQGVKIPVPPGRALVNEMRPIMIPQYEREQLGAGQMWDPFQMAPYTTPMPPYRTDLSVLNDMLQRQGNVFTDIPHLVPT
jgi:hypothetical protein